MASLEASDAAIAASAAAAEADEDGGDDEVKVIEENLNELLRSSEHARFLATEHAIKLIKDKGITLTELRAMNEKEIDHIAGALKYGVLDTGRFKRVISISITTTRTPATGNRTKKRAGFSSTASGGRGGVGLSLKEARDLRASVAKAHGQEKAVQQPNLENGAVVMEVKNVKTNLADVYLSLRSAIDLEYGFTSTVTSDTITLKMTEAAAAAFRKSAAAVSSYAAAISALGTPHFKAVMKTKKTTIAEAEKEAEKKAVVFLAEFDSESAIDEKEGAAWLEVDGEYEEQLNALDEEKRLASGAIAKKVALDKYEQLRLEKQAKLDAIGVQFLGIKRQFKAAQDAADAIDEKRKRAAPANTQPWNSFQKECAEMGITSQQKVKELWETQKAKAARLADDAARDASAADDPPSNNADDADAEDDGDMADDAPPPPPPTTTTATAPDAGGAAATAAAASPAPPAMIDAWRAALRE